MSALMASNMAVLRLVTQLCLFLVPGGWGEHALPKFICSPMPLDMDSICQSAASRHNGGNSGHWTGPHEEPKETILQLRETVVHQKETILDQRETIRELTAKMARCEGHSRSRGHEHSYTAENGQEESHGGHEREHGGLERGHGYEESRGHSREHGSHERERGGHERDYGHEREHGGLDRVHGPEREYSPEWEHGHEREHGGHEREHGGYEESRGHGRDYDYHHFGHRQYHEQQQQPPQYRKGSQTQSTMGETLREAAFDPLQMEKMVESLKERLEHLQLSRNSSMFSASLRESLQKKIDVLEHQISLVNGTEEYNLPSHKLDADTIEKGSNVPKSSDGFRVAFPMRSDYLFVKVKRILRRELFAFTVSMWLKPSSSPGMGTPFSYAVPGQANEVVLIEWGNNPMELLINDKAATLPFTISDAKWHHLCIIWSTRDGAWEAYQDGVRKGSGDNLAPWHPIKPGGVFILGQEQDTLGGRFDATQAYVGEMSDFNIWSHTLTPSEIFELATCASHATGDIIEWTEPSMELHGGAIKLPFNSCH